MGTKTPMSVLDDVKKDLGKKAELPKEVDELQKAFERANKKSDDFAKVFATMNSTIDGIQKEGENLSKHLDKASKAVAKDNFGLDPSNKDEKAKILDARKDLLETFRKVEKAIDTGSTSFEKLNATIASVAKGNGIA